VISQNFYRVFNVLGTAVCRLLLFLLVLQLVLLVKPQDTYMADIYFTVFRVMTPCSLVYIFRNFGTLDASIFTVDETTVLIDRFRFSFM